MAGDGSLRRRAGAWGVPGDFPHTHGRSGSNGREKELGLRVKQAHFRPSVLTSYRTLLGKNSDGIYGPS